MEHSLNVCVCLDTDMSSVRIEVRGCVTARNYKALLPLLTRAKGLPADAQISLDLREAAHLEQDVLDALGYTALGEMTGQLEIAGIGSMSIVLPPNPGVCMQGELPGSSQPIRPAQPAAA
ncbi:hypothetical protein [Arthrobacter crystallopoietes]|uniref:STAS domain-containing protein n=1 Tax=Crystallibacter crystallopoietes TaxID=37928 RepID=A0A1H1BQK0_9MICC|nr:hypothetical protein [Arthrobacter crystallopoietes]SDQ54169.1 hypothetical protein SAMN04489742_1519 [Arthrobacter crystallopoietes]